MRITIEIPDDELERALKPLLAALRGPVAPSSPEPARMLTVPQAAQRLGIGKSKAYELINRGDLAVLRIGRLVRVTEEALDAFVRTHEGSADREAPEVLPPRPQPSAMPPATAVTRRRAPSPKATRSKAQRGEQDPRPPSRKQTLEDRVSPAEFAKVIEVPEEAARELYQAGHFPVIDAHGGLTARRGDLLDWIERDKETYRAWQDRHSLWGRGVKEG